MRTEVCPIRVIHDVSYGNTEWKRLALWLLHIYQ